MVTWKALAHHSTQSCNGFIEECESQILADSSSIEAELSTFLQVYEVLQRGLHELPDHEQIDGFLQAANEILPEVAQDETDLDRYHEIMADVLDQAAALGVEAPAMTFDWERFGRNGAIYRVSRSS